MPIQLYIDYVSQPSRAVLAFCKIQQIPIIIRQIRIAKLEHLNEQYQKINPMKKVPAIKDTQNGLLLGESHAIMNYLASKFSKKSLLRPQNDEILAAKIEQYLHYHHANTRKCALLLYASLFSKLYPVQHGSIPNSQVVADEVTKVLTFLEKWYFKDSKYLIGKELSAADLAAYFQIQSLELIEYDFSRLKKITNWMKVMREIKEVEQSDYNYKKVVPKMKRLRASL